MSNETDKTPLLLPILLLSFSVAGILAYQTCMLVSDRVTINTAYEQQERILVQVDKVKAQASALVKGVMDLSQQGNKNAQSIVDDLKKAGINFESKPQATDTAKIPAPADTETAPDEKK
jgi:hypothetical protein